jgi:SAM-dependent methyltransferase
MIEPVSREASTGKRPVTRGVGYFGRAIVHTAALVKRVLPPSAWEGLRVATGKALLTREAIARTYLKGEGIEIGALHRPLAIPRAAQVKYVDRMPVRNLRAQYVDIDPKSLVDVDIVADGETLDGIPDESQNFVIANHFLEHCQNPILALENMLRVLQPEGIVYLAVPDKRYTFDIDRPVTPLSHVIRDYSEGPAWSKRQHFEEWSRLVNKAPSEEQVQVESDHLMGIDYSIHFHVWTQAELLELVLELRRTLGNFNIQLMFETGNEDILILRKTVPRSQGATGR